MNPFLIAYMKWATDLMTVSYQVNQAMLNQATGATHRAKKQQVSAKVVPIGVRRENT